MFARHKKKIRLRQISASLVQFFHIAGSRSGTRLCISSEGAGRNPQPLFPSYRAQTRQVKKKFVFLPLLKMTRRVENLYCEIAGFAVG
jgi:hypothetical protein